MTNWRPLSPAPFTSSPRDCDERLNCLLILLFCEHSFSSQRHLSENRLSCVRNTAAFGALAKSFRPSQLRANSRPIISASESSAVSFRVHVHRQSAEDTLASSLRWSISRFASFILESERKCIFRVRRKRFFFAFIFNWFCDASVFLPDIFFFYKNLSKLHCSPSTAFAFASNSPALILFPEISCNYPQAPTLSHNKICKRIVFSFKNLQAVKCSFLSLSVIAIDLALAKLQLSVWLYASKKVSFAASKLCFLLENVKLFDSILSPLLSPPIRRDSLISAFVLV